MARLKKPRLEALAWALASGMMNEEATRFAGYAWCGYAPVRMKKAALVERVKELRPLVENGAGPDPLSQRLAELAGEALTSKTPERLAAAQGLVKDAFAARERAVKRQEARNVAAGRTVKRPWRQPKPKPDPAAHPDVTLSLEDWKALYGAPESP